MTRRTILSGFALALIGAMVRVPVDVTTTFADGSKQTSLDWVWLWSMADVTSGTLSTFLLAEILALAVLCWLVLRIADYVPPKHSMNGHRRLAADGFGVSALDFAGRRQQPRMHPDDWLN